MELCPSGSLDSLIKKVDKKQPFDNQTVLNVLCELAKSSETGVLLIIDELGKNLEYSALQADDDSLFLLQQIAELPTSKNHPKIFLFGLLHQSFHDYAHNLTIANRNEWGKVQGRFEDIPFTESPEQTLRLIGHAIDQRKAKSISKPMANWANKWAKTVSKNGKLAVKWLSRENLSSIYPLHPLSALALPVLCGRYAQNDRSIFSFLASAEPHSFASFLNECSFKAKELSTIKLHRIYDYFVESAGLSIASRPQFQRWIEIQGRISEANHLDPDVLLLIKTIGILNLTGTTGAFLKATRKLTILAMCDKPDNPFEIKKWDESIDFLIKMGFVVWRKQSDELRIWEGSDFNIEEEVSKQVEMEQESLPQLLAKFSPLQPFVAQRHSYQTGTLRYFERQFINDPKKLEAIKCSSNDNDGLIIYWVGDNKDIKKIPSKTFDNKPLIVVLPNKLNALHSVCIEFAALNRIKEKAAQIDGIARREVRQRLAYAKKELDKQLYHSFNLTDKKVKTWICGTLKIIPNERVFYSQLSEVCDRAYNKGLKLWNELINRRAPTSQGAKARGILIKAMLQSVDVERFGLEGYGPEISIYNSLLKETGIHRKSGENWEISSPNHSSGVTFVWEAIENFCLSGTEKPRPLTLLYKQLNDPPYGVKRGVILILLAAVLLKHQDDVGIYYDGTFIPILGDEHFELFEKNLDRFSVKHFQIAGLRVQVFKELESIVSKSSKHYNQGSKKVRNAKLLDIVRPLIRFVKYLPKYTLKTKELTHEAIAVREALLNAREPDHLIFYDLPKACNIEPILPESEKDVEKAQKLKIELIKAMKELQLAYDNLLSQCRDLLHKAFSIRSEKDKIREDLRVRAHYLTDKCIEPRLRSFLFAAIEETADDRQWLESIIMVIADKPAESWNDENVIGFEMQLSDIARIFINLESLQNNLAREPKKGLIAQKITITHSDGREVHRTIWIERETQEKIDKIVNNIIEKDIMKNNEPLQKAIVASLIEKVLSPKKEEKVKSKKEVKKWQKRKYATS